MKYILLMSLFLYNVIFAQSIYKNWYSDSTQNCIKIKRKGFSQLNDSKYIKIKKRGSKLIVFRRYGFFQTKRYEAIFDIIKLTEDTLVLSRANIPMNQRKFEELGHDIIIFKVSTKNCLNFISCKLIHTHIFSLGKYIFDP